MPRLEPAGDSCYDLGRWKLATLRFLQLEVARLSGENRDRSRSLAACGLGCALSALQDIIQRMTPDVDPLVLIDDLLAPALKAVGSSDGSLCFGTKKPTRWSSPWCTAEARERLTGYRLPRAPGSPAGWPSTGGRWWCAMC
jgi:hypothetical protein